MKLKRIMASILCLAMVLSTIGTVAFANNTEADVWDGTVDTSWYNATDTEFTITTAEQWAGFAYLVNGAQADNPAVNTKETADFGYYCGKNAPKSDATGIDFSDVTIKLGADLDFCAVDENGDLVKLYGGENLSMMPVGYSKKTPFKGTFDGQGHTIKNLFQGGWDLYGFADSSDGVYLGLFGFVQDATIRNLVIDNFNFNCEMTLGTVAGMSSGRSVYDGITIKNTTVPGSGGWRAGGLIGWAYGNQTISNIDIDETNTVAQSGGHYDTAVGGILGGCNNVDGETIDFINCDVACKLDVYNDCVANYDTNSYRNCGMIIGAIGEDNEIEIGGKLYPNFAAKGLTFDNVNVTIGEWANYTYCYSNALPMNCQRIEPGVGYTGVDVSKLADYSIEEERPFDAVFGAENAGNLSKVRGAVNTRVMEFLESEVGFSFGGITVYDAAYLERTAVELYVPATITRTAQLVFVDTFGSLEEALASIGTEEGEYIFKVIKDIDEDVVITQNPNQKITITGDEDNKPVISGSIQIDGRSANIATAATVIENIVFDAAGAEGDRVIGVYDGNTRYTSNVTIANCDFVDYDADKDIVAIKQSTGGCHNWLVTGCTATGMHSLIQAQNIEEGFVVEDCVIADCKNGVNVNSSVSFEMTGTTIEADGYGVRVGSSKDSTTPISIKLENNTINAGSADPDDAAIVLRKGASAANVTITSGTYNSANGANAIYSEAPTADVAISGGDFSSDVQEYLADGVEITKTANGYKVIADENSTTNDEEKQADSISVIYKDVTIAGVEGEKTYEIVVKANENDMINELASLDLTFAFTEAPISNGDITFTVAPAAEFAMTEHDSTVREELTKRYMFNYNGVDAYEDTANEIVVGTITVTGYGEFKIATADVETNIVNATTIYDNLVDSYTVAGATDDDETTGALDISGKVDDGEITVPVRTLTINIDFPNAVEDNAIAYQDMKVEITGTIDGVQQTITYNLGTDEEAMNAEGSYVVTEDRLVLNNAYTVTVSGAGYRTARYTVTMTEDKALKFWNNVMDEAQVVEIGKDSSAVNVTFLAGDIVKDNKINIYDLSAVVSYFGTQTVDEGVILNAEYAKYDLNRDGVIDSKDVAYVLVSWDN